MKLKGISESLRSRYAEIPADVGRQIGEVQQSLQKAEEAVMINHPVQACWNLNACFWQMLLIIFLAAALGEEQPGQEAGG